MDVQTLQLLEQQVSAIINEHVDLIVVDAKSLADARARSAKFLVAQSTLSTFLKTFEDDRAKATTLTSVQYAQALSSIEGSKITEKKIQVANDQNYTAAREMQERIEEFKTWIKTHMKIFENAHLMFRQYARD